MAGVRGMEIARGPAAAKRRGDRTLPDGRRRAPRYSRWAGPGPGESAAWLTPRTRYRGVVLRFTVGDIPVGVHITFLLIALFGPRGRVIDMAVWVIVAFVAILLHELGHAVVARHYGAVPVRVTLFAMGGVTTYPANDDLTPGRRFLIAGAGSAVGIVTGGCVALLWFGGVFDDAGTIVRGAAGGYMWAALGWGLLNWIPVRPLDGGAMLTSFLEIVAPRNALNIARTVSLVFGIAAAYALYQWAGSTFGAVFILFLTLVGLRDDRPDSARQRSTTRPVRVEPETGEDPSDDGPPPAFPI